MTTFSHSQLLNHNQGLEEQLYRQQLLLLLQKLPNLF